MWRKKNLTTFQIAQRARSHYATTFQQESAPTNDPMPNWENSDKEMAALKKIADDGGRGVQINVRPH
jgi:hypothetical protein